MATGGKGIKPTARYTPVFNRLWQLKQKIGVRPRFFLPLSVNRLPLWIEYRRALVLVAVVDPAACHVVRRHLQPHAVARKDADAVLAHPPAGIGKHGRAVFQLDAELRVGQHFLDGPVHFKHLFFGHDKPRALTRAQLNCRIWTTTGSPHYTCERSHFLNALTAGRSAMTSGQTR